VSRLLTALQLILAAVFLFAASFKLLAPVELIQAQLPLPELYIRGIGTIELLGALGLTLPAMLRILPILTPLAAAGLVILMTGATLLSPALTGDLTSSALPLVLGLLCAFVAYGRTRLAPITPRVRQRGALAFANR
jgi:DoxX-like protein